MCTKCTSSGLWNACYQPTTRHRKWGWARTPLAHLVPDWHQLSKRCLLHQALGLLRAVWSSAVDIAVWTPQLGISTEGLQSPVFTQALRIFPSSLIELLSFWLTSHFLVFSLRALSQTPGKFIRKCCKSIFKCVQHPNPSSIPCSHSRWRDGTSSIGLTSP